MFTGEFAGVATVPGRAPTDAADPADEPDGAAWLAVAPGWVDAWVSEPAVNAGATDVVPDWLEPTPTDPSEPAVKAGTPDDRPSDPASAAAEA